MARIEAVEAVATLAFSPGGEYLVSGGREGNISLWKASTRERLTTWRGHQAEVVKIVFDAGEDSFFSCARNGEVRRWRLDRIWQGLREMRLHW